VAIKKELKEFFGRLKLRGHPSSKSYQLVECPTRCCGFSRELRQTNITKTTHKIKENN
jgi:hypothetical protein